MLSAEAMARSSCWQVSNCWGVRPDLEKYEPTRGIVIEHEKGESKFIVSIWATRIGVPPLLVLGPDSWTLSSRIKHELV